MAGNNMTTPSYIEDSLRSAGLLSVWHKLLAGERLDLSDGIQLFACPDVALLGWMANRARETLHGDRAYFNRNLHINATNVCEASCIFCSFARLKTGDPQSWTMTMQQALERVRVLKDELVTEVHIVNGLNPDLPYDYYLKLLTSLKEERPELHCKGFTAVEIHYYAEKYGMSYVEVLETMRSAGLDSMPGGGAEIFAERARKKLCDDKVDADGWLEIHRVAHRLGFRTNATMLFGSIETSEERVDHLIRLRALQDESLSGAQTADHAGGHFQTFIPLRFHNDNNRLARLASPTGYDSLRTIAVARLMLDNFPHVKAYWPMLGTNEAQAALHFGASDLDGTVREEHIYHMAGADTPQGLSRAELVRFIEHARRTAVERDTVYNVVRRTDAAVPPSQPPHARVGWVEYENATPLVKHLTGVELRGGHPSEVAQWLAEGSVDIALLPVGALLTDPSADTDRGWSVVPDICIGAEGPVESVLLAAETPPEEWRRVLLDGVSRTSVLLARLLLTEGPLAARTRGVSFEVVPPGTGVEHARGDTATVVIGDAARALPARLTHRVDLAEIWTEWTGLPFVFAVWAGKPDLNPEVVAHIRAAGLRGLDDLARGTLTTDLSPDLHTYLTEKIRYPLDDAATMGLLRFAALAEARGLVSRHTFTLYDAPKWRSQSRSMSTTELLEAASVQRQLSEADLVTLDEHAPTMDLLVAAGTRRRDLFGAAHATYAAASSGTISTIAIDPREPLPALPESTPFRAQLMFGAGETAAERARLLKQLGDSSSSLRVVTWAAQERTTDTPETANNTALQWLRLTALARLALQATVHVEGNWRLHGRGLGQVVLHGGADDFGTVSDDTTAHEMVDGVWPMSVREAERNLRMAGFEPSVRDGGFTEVTEASTKADPVGRPMRRLTPLPPAQ